MLSWSPITSALMITYLHHHGFNKLAKVVLFKSLVVWESLVWWDTWLGQCWEAIYLSAVKCDCMMKLLMAFKNVDVEVMVTFSCREWAIHDNPYPKEQIVENSTRADLKLSELAERNCVVWGLTEHKCASWFMRVVVLEYALPCLFGPSVLEEQCNPLESRLIGVGICHRFWELSEAAIGLLISFLNPDWSTKDTRWLLQLESTVLSPTPSRSWLEVDRGWFLPEKSPFSISRFGIDCKVPTCYSVYIWIVAEEHTRSAQCGGTAPVQRYCTLVKSSLKTMWNWGEIRPVLGLRMSATLEVCEGEQPT